MFRFRNTKYRIKQYAQGQDYRFLQIYAKVVLTGGWELDWAKRRKFDAKRELYIKIQNNRSREGQDYAINNNIQSSPDRSRTGVPGTKTRNDGPLHYRTLPPPRQI